MERKRSRIARERDGARQRLKGKKVVGKERKGSRESRK